MFSPQWSVYYDCVSVCLFFRGRGKRAKGDDDSGKGCPSLEGVRPAQP